MGRTLNLKRLRALRLWCSMRIRATSLPTFVGSSVAAILLLLLLQHFCSYFHRSEVGRVADKYSLDPLTMTAGAQSTNSQALSPLLAWLHSHGAVLHPCLRVASCGSGGGRCVVTECLVRRSDLLLSVPQALQLRPPAGPWEKPTTCPELSELLARPPSEGGAAGLNLDVHTTRLILRLLEERALGSRSAWAPYIPTIPHEYSQLLWDKDAQKECLAHTPSASKISRRFERYAAQRAVLRQCSAGKDSDDTLLRWAVHSVGSRSYEFRDMNSEKQNQSIDNQRPMAVMVPLADMFNDAVENNAQWQWNISGSFDIVALADINAGTEVTLSYGKKTNDQLLTHYGFVHRHNREDLVQVDLLDPTTMARARWRVSIPLSFDAQLAASFLPRALGDLRTHHQGVKRGIEHNQRAALEALVLTSVQARCDEAASNWQSQVKTQDEVCLQYREDLVVLAQACAKFAQNAAAELDEQMMESMQSRAAGYPGEDPAADLVASLLTAWRADSRGALQL